MRDERDPAHHGRFRPIDIGRGPHQGGIRLYNERLVLSLIRRHGAMPKADLARMTGLSAQTASVIVNQLEADGLLCKEERQRGKVGQPSVPFSLNPDGAFSFGLKIGRRSADLVLTDFHGIVRHRLHLTYAYPEPGQLIAFATDGVHQIEAGLPPEQAARIVGLGLAAPNELWSWAIEVGAPPGALDVWRSIDLRAELALKVGRPVFVCNDATAACAAELVFGRNVGVLDFLYVFIGSFVGGGLVLNGALIAGRSGNAAALGSMPVPGPDGQVRQLIQCASLYTLESRLIREGKAAGWLWAEPGAWREAGTELDDWITEAASSLAYAVTAASAIIDFQGIVLDGAFPGWIRTRLVAAVAARLDAFNRQGLTPMRILAGTIGAAAREIGASCLPFMANFAPDREVFFKEID